MRALVVVVLWLWVTALATPAAAAPHKVLVLPVDGTADAATRTRLTQQIARLARGLDGQVATAEATFADTALAVGCDPQAPGCSDEVMATLAVDELVWATATKDADHTRLIVRRATRGSPPRTLSTMVAASDSTERGDAAIAPLFAPPGANDGQALRAGRTGTPPEPAPLPPAPLPPARTDPEPAIPTPGAGEVPPGPAAPGPTDSPRDRRLGIGFAVGSGVALVVGIALWSHFESLQDAIDHHATKTRADFTDLTALEDEAGGYAIAGDVFVVAGLAAGGLATYYLLRSHRHSNLALAPAPIRHGAGLTLTILGGL